jgi:DNA topoisomerase-3
VGGLLYDLLFIAEKPSLAEEVAKARAAQTGATHSKSGAGWTVGNDAVIGIFGHMYEQAQPAHYDEKYKKWRIEDLPIVPGKWKILPQEKALQRIGEVASLIGRSKGIVNVGDAGREGQLLIDELLYENGVDPFGPRVQRLWLQDLTTQKKIEALGNMFPNAQKKLLYDAAIGRQRADWMLGMNMSRFYSIKAQQAGSDAKISVGRVQTPTLRLVVVRDREIEKFIAVTHYLPTGVFSHENGKFKANWIIPADCEGLDLEGRLVDKNVADKVAAKVAGKTGQITSVDTQKKSKGPPLPFDLSALQKECSAKFGMGVQETLDVAQKLYETYKVASYPRSESTYLPTGILKDEAPQIVKALTGVDGELGRVGGGTNLSIRSQAWNDSKVTDHYAIIPTLEATPQKIAQLPDLERKVFDLIALRFLAQFYPDHRWDAQTVLLYVEGERFKATGRVLTDKGWKVVYSGPEEEDDEEEEKGEDQSLPRMVKGDPVKAESCDSIRKNTTPPSRLTEGTLVDLMQNVHKVVKDPEAKKRLKEVKGIGTGATRANIVGTLFSRTFLQKKGKQIVSTPLGRSVIDAVDDKLSDPVLTALWEGELQKVEEGDLPLDRFMGALEGQISKMIETLSQSAMKFAGGKDPLVGTGNPCPKCSVGKLETRVVRKEGPNKGKQYLVCSMNKGAEVPGSCDYLDFKIDVKDLPNTGKPCPTCGTGKQVTIGIMKKGERRPTAVLVCSTRRRDDKTSCQFIDWNDVKAKALPDDGKPCPKCGTGVMQTKMIRKDGPDKGKTFLACSANVMGDKSSCQHVDFSNIRPAVKPLPDHGKTCPACSKGTLVTKTVTKEGPNKGKPYLACTGYDPKVEGSCRHFDWGNPKLPGDGEECLVCRRGKMTTKQFTKDGTTKSYLGCSNWVKGNSDSCDNRIFPKEDRLPQEGGFGNEDKRRFPKNATSRGR